MTATCTRCAPVRTLSALEAAIVAAHVRIAAQPDVSFEAALREAVAALRERAS